MSVLIENGHINEYPYNHARILYGNVATSATATGSVTNFPASAALSDFTYERWKPAVSGDSITVTFSAQNINAIALAAHSDLNPVVEVRTVGGVFETVTAYPFEGPTLSSDFENQEYRLIDYSPDNEAILFLIKPRQADAVRVTVTYSSTAPTLGVIRVGNVLEMQRPFYQGHTPAMLAADETLRPNISESGEWLGASKLRQARDLKFDWQNLKAPWVRSKWYPFSKTITDSPFIIAWNPERFSADCFYASTSTVPKPNNSGPLNYQSISLSARGYSDGTDPEVENLAEVIFSDQYTFTRSTTATEYDIGGVQQTVNVDEPRFTYNPATNVAEGLLIEESRTQLAQYSERFDNAAWVKPAGYVKPDAIVSIDGKLTADQFVTSSSVEVQGVDQSITFTAANHAVSFYVKKDEFRYAQILFNAALTSEYANFDLDTGTVTDGTYIDADAVELSDGYYQLFIVATTAAANNTVSLHLIDSGSAARGATATGTGTGGIYLAKAMPETGRFPTSYVSSTDTFTSRVGTAWAFDSAGVLQSFATDIERTDAYGYATDGVLYPIGQLFEPERENLLLNSDSPATQSVTVTDATVYTLSVWGSGSAEVTTGGSGTATLGNPVTFTSSGTTVQVTVTGSLDYFNLEAGNYGTSPIITAGTSVTRSADVSSSAQTVRASETCIRTLGQEFNESGFTLFVNAKKINTTSGVAGYYVIDDGTANNRVSLFLDYTGGGGVGDQLTAIVNGTPGGGGNTIVPSGVASNDDEFHKAAISYSPGQILISVDGQDAVSASSDSPSGFTRLNVASLGGSGANSLTKDLRLYPTALSAAEIKELTTL